MAINTTAGLLDAIVLAVVGREETGTYGYKKIGRASCRERV